LKVVGVIPVRFDSQRFPGKALFKIEGKTVLEHVYTRACRYRAFERLIIATDDARIEQCARELGAECFVSKRRHSCGSERVAEAVAGIKTDIVVNIQGDEVLLKPELISAAIRAVRSDPSVSCGTVCHPIESDAEFANGDLVKVVIDRNRQALYFSRSPIPNIVDAKLRKGTPRLGHIGIYAFRKAALQRFARLKPTPYEKAEHLEQLRLIESGMKMKVSLTNFKNFSLNRKQDIPHIRRILQQERR